MRHILLSIAVLSVFSFGADAEDFVFPGPVIKNQAPFNDGRARVLSGTTCQKAYTGTDYAVKRAKILEETKTCVRNNLGISKDIGLDFGSGRYSDCIVPETYTLRGSISNPIWPVCCAKESGDGLRRFVCQLYVSPAQ